MVYYGIKVCLTALLVILVSEAAKRHVLLAGILASLPLVSLLAMTWLYIETKDPEKVADLAVNIFWMVFPSLVLFVVLPMLLRSNVNFYPALLLSCIATALAYGLITLMLGAGKP